MLFFLRQMDRIRHRREANMATGTHRPAPQLRLWSVSWDRGVWYSFKSLGKLARLNLGTSRNLQGLEKASTFYISIQKNQQLRFLSHLLFVRSLKVIISPVFLAFFPLLNYQEASKSREILKPATDSTEHSRNIQLILEKHHQSPAQTHINTIYRSSRQDPD